MSYGESEMKKKFGREDSPTAHRSNSDQLPDMRNPGQKHHMDMPQNYQPGPGSPTPTQSGPRQRGKLSRM